MNAAATALIAWGAFEDAAVKGGLSKDLVASWMERLRQLGRFTNADRLVQMCRTLSIGQ